MIELKNVSKFYPLGRGERQILRDINLTIHPGQKIGILGGNGAGKSTFVRLVSGAEEPTSGSIRRSMSVSWPLAFSGGFQGRLTGADNVRFICRIYGVDFASKMSFVDDFAELGRYLYEPVSTYSSGMRARLAFAISMTVDFDCYLIDEVFAVGDERFREKCNVELFQKRADKAMLIVSHNHKFVRERCDRFLIFKQGTLLECDNPAEAFAQLKLAA